MYMDDRYFSVHTKAHYIPVSNMYSIHIHFGLSAAPPPPNRTHATDSLVHIHRYPYLLLVEHPCRSAIFAMTGLACHGEAELTCLASHAMP
jgi:hypothetical protein